MRQAIEEAAKRLELKLPGIQWKPDGSAYWVASKGARKAGYQVRTLRLHFDNGEAPEVVARRLASLCLRAFAEMTEWMSGVPAATIGAPFGTVAWLAESFLTDKDSPFHSKRAATKHFYETSIKIIKDTIGKRTLNGVDGRDLRRWFLSWGRADGDGVLANHRRAYACIQTFRRLVSHGCEIRDRASIDLRQVIVDMEFSVPKGRKVAMTWEQASALRTKAREMGYPSIARAIVIQRSIALRQKDVIGEWLRLGEKAATGITDGKWRWHAGLIWGDHISDDMVLTKPLSKSNFEKVAEHDLKLHVAVIEELSDIPREARIGPVIIDEATKRPYKSEAFQHRFREVARAAGIPDSIRNMDARAGAVTEALDAGADLVDVADFTGHTETKTTRGYNRGTIKKTTRVTNQVVLFRDQNKG